MHSRNRLCRIRKLKENRVSDDQEAAEISEILTFDSFVHINMRLVESRSIHALI